jgi:TonB family protein
MMFDRFMDWFERHKFGVVGTLMLHTMVLFVMAMSKLPVKNEATTEEDIPLEMMAPQDLPLDPMLQPPLMAAVEVKNLTSNSRAEVRSSATFLSSRAQERISNDVESDLKDFEAAEFNRLAEERKAAGKEVVMPELDPSKWDKEKYMDKTPKPAKVEGLTTVSYEFDGEQRADVHLEVPAYLCKGQGRVLIRIQVDASGRVIKAELDPSSASDECMRQNALASASDARFTSLSGVNGQRGRITYIFLAQ